ncbi:MAG: RpoL/Rpb11 RNA polymerase subunit family protein [Nitrososphaerales archaeon]
MKKTYKGGLDNFFLPSLNLKVNSIADNAISVQIEKEDYSLADIVHKELLSVKHVKFAGVPPPHPLIKTLTIQIHTDGSKPTKALLEAIELSQEKISDLLAVTRQAFPSIGIKTASANEDRAEKNAESGSSQQST